MKQPIIAPYGSWRSPITADRIAKGSVGLGQIALDGRALYWTELRPAEAGRTVLVRRDADGTNQDVTPPPFSVRSRAHEYGGGAFAVCDGVVWFSNDADQRLYRQGRAESPAPVTGKSRRRFADLTVDQTRDRLICVCEDHGARDGEPVNTLVAIDAVGDITVLAEGADFYAAPRLSPDGRQLAWLSWDHPNMPWDGCRLTRAALDASGAVADPQPIAGGAAEALFQPEWSPDGSLYFVSDRTGWWNLYRWSEGQVEAVCSIEAEFGLPQWVFNMRTYCFVGPDRLLAVYFRDGVAKLARIDVETGDLDPIPVPFVEMQGLVSDGSRAYCVAGALREAPALVGIDPSSHSVSTLRASAGDPVDPRFISEVEPIRFESAAGRHAHAFYYPPRNADFAAPDGEMPPLIVKSHGGPTGQSGCAYNAKTQFWTSRGFAVLDVNYGGSTGFGRAYRQLLDGRWGIVDVEDCAAGAQWLIRQGLVDSGRVAITGGSAGGYTTLCALTFMDLFRAGASHYGIGDLEALARDTHKFESRYLDRLVGKWPEEAARYRERSPIHHANSLSCPVVFFQGSDDKVVPPNQAEAMVVALRRKGIPVAYVHFDGEGHGFRDAANIRAALEAELSFYGRVLGFATPEVAQRIEIDNLD